MNRRTAPSKVSVISLELWKRQQERRDKADSELLSASTQSFLPLVRALARLAAHRDSIALGRPK